MKSLFTSIFIICMTPLSGSAWSLKTEMMTRPDGSYAQAHIYRCEADKETFCHDLCANPIECRQLESTCTSCAGSSSQFLRTLFTRADLYYTVHGAEVESNEYVSFAQRENFIIINPKSIYNFYKPWNSPEIQANFLNLCPSEITTSAHFVIGLDAREVPSFFDYVLCTLNTGETKILRAQRQRHVRPGELKLSTTLSQVPGTQLKLSYELKINKPSQRGQKGEIP